jgi:hypothetical protein
MTGPVKSTLLLSGAGGSTTLSRSYSVFSVAT